MAETSRTRIYLHDGLGTRIGELTTVRAVARSFELGAAAPQLVRLGGDMARTGPQELQ